MTRRNLHEQGLATRATLGMEEPADTGHPGRDDFHNFLTEAVYGAVWSRAGLALEERMVCTLAAQSVLGCADQLPAMIRAALHIGMDARAIVEVFAQGGIYGGFDRAESAIAAAERVFAERGVAVPTDAPRRGEPETLEGLGERGQAFLEALHGEASTQGYASPDNPVTGQLYALATQYGYGELWVRPGLDRRQRLFCALAAFTVLGLESQLRKFSQSALRIGFSRQEVIEAIIQTMPHGGFARALNGLTIVGEATAGSTWAIP